MFSQTGIVKVRWRIIKMRMQLFAEQKWWQDAPVIKCIRNENSPAFTHLPRRAFELPCPTDIMWRHYVHARCCDITPFIPSNWTRKTYRRNQFNYFTIGNRGSKKTLIEKWSQKEYMERFEREKGRDRDWFWIPWALRYLRPSKTGSALHRRGTFMGCS